MSRKLEARSFRPQECTLPRKFFCERACLLGGDFLRPALLHVRGRMITSRGIAASAATIFSGGRVKKQKTLILAALTLLSAFFGGHAGPAWAQGGSAMATGRVENRKATWMFAVSGDSRNRGDVVMPGIAAGVQQSGSAFYWHLGDFRWISKIDEDILHQPEHLNTPLTMPEYYDLAWKDFIASQIAPFRTIPLYLGIGNHETVLPKTRAEYIAQFAHWIDAPNLRAQRLQDDSSDLAPKTFYHWIVYQGAKGGLDFINLDNSVENDFDEEQMLWFEKTLNADYTNPRIRTIVVGMHEALPESISKDHAMDQTESGSESGKRVYADLLKARADEHKRVYVLASHSHYYMEGIFNTDYWLSHGGVLPGWIIGTAGAVRYKLPEAAKNARVARTNVYGFLTGKVHSDGRIDFAFHLLNETDIPAAVLGRYTPEFVHWCFVENSQAR
jgi:hypothetical protein